MKVLMATDGSKRTTAILASAARFLSANHRDVDLMCVVPEPRGKHRTHAEKLCRRAKHFLDAAKAALQANGVSVRPVVKTGSPARTLIGTSLNYDLTVIAAASSRDGSSEGLGPVASRVLEHSNATVLVARETRGDTGIRVLAPVDGSEASLRALDQLVKYADLSDAEVTLLHVVESPWLHPGPDQEWLGYEEDNEEQIDTQAQLQAEFVREGYQIVEDARNRLPVRTVVNTLVTEGLPADEILSEAERDAYDLVVVGAGGATDLKHQILGSVSSKVAWNAPCSVLFVRSQD
jgi:nucleotide-binding universal stress UspA family protein